MIQKHPNHKEHQPASCPDREWNAMYVREPSRDWTCADLEKFINGPSKEPKAKARKQLAFRRKYGLR